MWSVTWHGSDATATLPTQTSSNNVLLTKLLIYLIMLWPRDIVCCTLDWIYTWQSRNMWFSSDCFIFVTFKTWKIINMCMFYHFYCLKIAKYQWKLFALIAEPPQALIHAKFRQALYFQLYGLLISFLEEVFCWQQCLLLDILVQRKDGVYNLDKVKQCRFLKRGILWNSFSTQTSSRLLCLSW